MCEIAWKEFSKSGRLVVKRKSFNDANKMDRFIQRLFEKDNFYGLMAFK